MQLVSLLILLHEDLKFVSSADQVYRSFCHLIPFHYDILLIEGLVLEMSIGVYEHEKAAKQRVLVSVEATTLPNTAYKSDDIAEALSYEEMVNVVKALAQGRHYELVESFAEDIAQALFERPQVEALKITVKKPDIFKEAKAVGITISRNRV